VSERRVGVDFGGRDESRMKQTTDVEELIRLGPRKVEPGLMFCLQGNGNETEKNSQELQQHQKKKDSRQLQWGRLFESTPHCRGK
jgi:hypothetical protein